jgi:ABC-type amino acid transport substrate-binding protein
VIGNDKRGIFGQPPNKTISGILTYFREASMKIDMLLGRVMLPMLAIALLLVHADDHVWGGDIEEVLKAGKLRHLGIVYANFVTEDKKGLDVELVQQFADHLGVQYEFVETNWQDIVADLTGKVVKPQGENIELIGDKPVRGDIIATGFTILPWREKIVEFSTPTFPTGVWLISRADSTLEPIAPTDDISHDINAVKKELKGKSVLSLKDSCLDPDLYGLDKTGAEIKLFPADRNLNEMIPAVIARTADATLMDVPVALIALEKWPGEIKVVGPISPMQGMACAFPQTSPKLREAFEEFFRQLKADGSYNGLVRKYYPSVFSYYPDFFKK